MFQNSKLGWLSTTTRGVDYAEMTSTTCFCGKIDVVSNPIIYYHREPSTQHKITMIPSNADTCHAHICHNLLVSHVEKCILAHVKMKLGALYLDHSHLNSMMSDFVDVVRIFIYVLEGMNGKDAWVTM